MLALDRLTDRPDARHIEARAFCLAVIKEFYSTDYRSDWHADLDSLTGEPARSWYSSLNRGAFWMARDDDGAIVATAGLYHLGWKPNLATELAALYPRPDRVPQLARVYVRADQRGRQIGRWLNDIAEAGARRLGYDRLYLHASADAPATLGFWRGRGYAEIAALGAYFHFDKTLSNSP
ncbi:hypothetical protein AXW83_16585 [Bosea sp. PAMC 26642]|nr:hypothetical protein AXW83_16585 [Bosea sp. PAMC 26642]